MQLPRIKTSGYEENLIGFSDFSEKWSKNESWTISFLLTKLKENEFVYNLIANENIIVFDDEEFVIKNADLVPNTGKISVKSVKATHVMYELQDHRQDEIKSGKLTHSIEEVLEFGLAGNEQGFDWETVGTFDKIISENLGDFNGLEAIEFICEHFEAVVIPHKRHLVFFSEESFGKLTQNKFREGYNTFGMEVSIDTTSLKTAIKGYAKKDDDGNYLLAPMTYVSPNAGKWNNGKLKWAKPVSDETITQADTMLVRLKKELNDEPAVSLKTNTIERESFEKGDTWVYINDAEEIKTDVTVVGYTKYPYNLAKNYEVIFSNTNKSMTQINMDIQSNAKKGASIYDNPISFVGENMPTAYRNAVIQTKKNKRNVENVSEKIDEEIKKGETDKEELEEKISTAQSDAEKYADEVAKEWDKTFGEEKETILSEVSGNINDLENKFNNLEINPENVTDELKEALKGQDAYHVEVISTQGNIFKNGIINTTLSAIVYKGNEDITNAINAAYFIWTRISADSVGDDAWNTEHAGGAKSIQITQEDLYVKATFSCAVSKEE